MNSDSESSLFRFPVTPYDYPPDIFKIEENATKALRNINLIYNEIMSPKEYNFEESTNLNNNDVVENIPIFSGQQNHYVKSCCSTLRELCVKCDRYIAHCASCNNCNCCISNNNLKNMRNLENIDDLHNCSNFEGRDKLKVKCTIPNPFSLYIKNEERRKAKEEKILKLKQDQQQKIESELKIRANCKKVPQSTHLPLYNQMVQEKEKIKAERKEKCLEILNNAKPFTLHSMKRSEKAKSSTDLTSKNTFNFKAKPVPKHILSNKFSEKLKNKEEVRKMLIIERAKQTKEQSLSPFSSKPTYSRSLTDLCKLNKAKDKEQLKPKNVSEITERLYIKKCNETLNCWNKKVLQVEAAKDIENIGIQNLFINERTLFPKKTLNEEELPFMYFPVRMSNAAILREKLIRSEISAREEREKRKTENEFTKKKINSEILHKLQTLIPTSDGEKEIYEKVKSFRESQTRRKHEYKKELEEIRKRVSEQNLLLERQSKIITEKLPIAIESDAATESNQKASESKDSESQKSISLNSDTIDSSNNS